MKKNRFTKTIYYLRNALLAMLLVLATSAIMFMIGRDVLGEGVIALLYLLPVTWSAYRWGQLAGISAALTAFLTFNFLFIPPFFTFVIGRIEGWLLLIIFLSVAIIVVEWVQSGMVKAREATFMYELSSALSNQRSPEGVAYSLARMISQLYQASLVNVLYCPDRQNISIAASEPIDGTGTGKPDRIIPIVNAWGLVGEIQIWRGPILSLPPVESRLFQDFGRQAARAFERTVSVDSTKEKSSIVSRK